MISQTGTIRNEKTGTIRNGINVHAIQKKWHILNRNHWHNKTGMGGTS